MHTLWIFVVGEGSRMAFFQIFAIWVAVWGPIGHHFGNLFAFFGGLIFEAKKVETSMVRRMQDWRGRRQTRGPWSLQNLQNLTCRILSKSHHAWLPPDGDAAN